MSLKRTDWVRNNDLKNLKGTRAYLSAILLYQYDCWSALKYVNTTHQVANAMVFFSNLTRITSNALAMVTAMERFGDDLSLWVPPQTERDGYWPDSGGSDDGVLPVFPDALVADVTVCKTGDCDYMMVQEAVNAAPDNGQKHFVIKISSGTYEERVRVPFEKTRLVFIGEGVGKTIITGKLNAQMSGVTTYNTATVGVSGDGFMAKDITFENAAGPGSHQAVAFMSDSDMSILYSVEFLGHQDTLYARSMRQFYHSCRISGTVDFIFGNSASMFYNSSVIVVPRQEGPEKGESNAVTAHGRTDPGQSTGFVFKICTVNGSEEYVNIYRKRPGRHKVYLGRPWKEFSRTVFLHCNLEEVVRPEGWMPWKGEFALKTLFYGEFENVGLGANENGRVEWSSRIPEEHLDAYSVKNYLQGDEWTN